MFEQYAAFKSPGQVKAWLQAIVEANGPAYPSFPDDCAVIVEHFAKVGVSITAEEAASFWDAYSESLQSGWITLAKDCVAALDGLVEEIEGGSCLVECLAGLQGTVNPGQ